MTTKATLIQQAEFNPRIKSYIFWVGVFFLAITIIGIPILLIWAFGAGQYFSRRYYENLKCNLTTRHLQFKKGVLFKVEKTIPLENIQDLTFVENPFLNYFGLKILKIETAGNSNSTGSDMTLVGIVEAESFKNKVMDQRDQLKSSETSNDESTLEVLKEIRALLTEIKNK